MKHDLNLSVPIVDFNSNLVQLIMQLEVLRNQNLVIDINPKLFTQVKAIFHMVESLQSARIEGNRTTISNTVTESFTASIIAPGPNVVISWFGRISPNL